MQLGEKFLSTFCPVYSVRRPLDFANCNRYAVKEPRNPCSAFGTPPFGSDKILALNCRLISRTAIAMQPRSREILGVRALRAAFRIKQDP
jgi:hypothetical protein